MRRNCMTFWRCYYHLVWATKNRAPLISPQIETVVIHAIKEKSVKLESPIIAINTVSDHIHVAVSIPPKLAVSEWARNVKGYSTHEVNAMFPDLPSPFYWQNGFAVLSFGLKTLGYVSDYVNRQKEHHANQTTEDYLEIIDEPR
ncbi:MAG: IS200/IS605 family transposase [Chloroflexi bacterium]|nr:MAG: IS200/IS605 family transposase [Chloroflexota bacterium]